MAAAGAVVTMTDTARDRLLVGYAVDPAQGHGHPARRRRPRRRARATARPPAPAHLGAARPRQGHRVGAAGPGRGCRTSTRARPTRSPGGPTRRCSSTHGEAYRAGLHQLGAPAGRRARRATTEAVYLDQAALGRLIRSADVVVLPYDSREQVTSGVLIEAVAAGVPVVATAFPHAVELLTDGPGLLVPHQDPAALAARDPADPRPSPAWPPGWPAASPAAATLRWPAVAARYARRSPTRLVDRRPAAPSARCRRDARPRSRP